MLGFWILICHLIGDYVLQSDWMAEGKTKRDIPGLTHALVYTICFYPLLIGLHRPTLAMFVILWTHFFIDRFRLARYVVWVKNWIGPLWRPETDKERLERIEQGYRDKPSYTAWHEWDNIFGVRQRWGGMSRRINEPLWQCGPSGYPKEVPAWMATWLLIIADNTIHLLIAGLVITYL